VSIGRSVTGGHARLLALVIALSGPSARAIAQEDAAADGARLAWVRGEGAAGCVDGESLAGEVRARLGRDPFRGEVRQTIEGLVGRREGRWVAQLFDRDATGAAVGARELTSDAASCRALDPALALAIALAIDPEAAMRPTDASPQEVDGAWEGTATDRTASDRAERDLTVASREAARRVPASSGDPATGAPARILASPSGASETAPAASTSLAEAPAGVAVSLLGAIDLVPGPALGVAITTDAVLLAPLRWRVGMLYVPEARTGGPGAEFGLGLTAATLDACVVALEAGPVAGTACIGAAVGAIHAVVYAPIPTRPGDHAWGAARASAEVSIAIDRHLWLALAVSGTVPFVRWAFRVEGRPGIEFQEAIVVPGATATLGARFW
jgi:hypothetical protein